MILKFSYKWFNLALLHRKYSREVLRIILVFLFWVGPFITPSLLCMPKLHKEIVLPSIPASVKKRCSSYHAITGTIAKIRLISHSILPEERPYLSIKIVVMSNEPVLLPQGSWYDFLLVEAFDTDGNALGSWREQNDGFMAAKQVCCGTVLKRRVLVGYPLAERATTHRILLRVSVVYSTLNTSGPRARQCSRYTKIFTAKITKKKKVILKKLIERDYKRAFRHPTRHNLIKLMRHTDPLAQELALQLAKKKSQQMSKQDYAFILVNVAPFTNDTMIPRLIDMANGDDFLLIEMSRYFFKKRSDAAINFAINKIISDYAFFSKESCVNYIIKHGTVEDLKKIESILNSSELTDENRRTMGNAINGLKARLHKEAGE